MFLATHGVIRNNSGGGYTTRTQALITATGLSDATKINAINTFDLGLISNGLLTDSNDALYFGFLGSAIANKYNFIDTTKFELTFLGGWDFTNGMKGNGTNAYAKTGWIPSARSPLGSSYGVYSRDLVTANASLLSSYTGAATGYYGPIGKNSTSIDMTNQSSYTGANTWSGLSNIKGFIQSSKLHSSSIQNVSLNTTQSSLTMASSSLSSREVYISTFNNLGVPTSGYYATQDLCCIYLSSQVFTQAQQLTFNSLTNTLLTTLGLNV
jgi:hypothetical protein